MVQSDTARSIEFIINAYAEVYQRAYGTKPNIVHKGNLWFAVDDREVIHRSALLGEIARLRKLILEQQARQEVHETTHRKSLISRLITKLRGM